MCLNFMFKSQFAYVNPAKKWGLAPLSSLQQSTHTHTEIKPLLLPSSALFAATGALPALCLGVCQVAEAKNLPDLTQLNL